MEDNKNRTYTYRRSKKKAKRRTQLILLCGFALMLFLCIVFGALFGNRSAVRKIEEERSLLNVTDTSVHSNTEDATGDVSPYQPGIYVVDTEGAALNLRRSYSMNSEILTEIQNSTQVTITEIYRDKEASVGVGDIEYWGRCTYNGNTGWVAMRYLKKDTSIPAEDTTDAPEITTEAEKTTEAESLVQERKGKEAELADLQKQRAALEEQLAEKKEAGHGL